MDNHDYPVLIEEGLLSHVSLWLPTLLKSQTIVIVTDHIVKPLYADPIEASLRAMGYRVLLLTVTAGEASKTQEVKTALEHQMLEALCDRQTVMLAIGGGVIGDLTGFIASTYMRGIQYLQIPTTLLAMVDSAIGGKTGINTPYGKNLIGSFWLPTKVIIDPRCLKTLPEDHLINGWVEMVKIFAITDTVAFNATRDFSSINSASWIAHAISLKQRITTADPNEQGPRALLNFGHTLAHALEQMTDYQVLHGHAVALGMLVEARVALQMGICSQATYDELSYTIHSLPIAAAKEAFNKAFPETLIKLMHNDKKNEAKAIRMPLIKRMGESYYAIQGAANPYTHPIPIEQLRLALNTERSHGR